MKVPRLFLQLRHEHDISEHLYFHKTQNPWKDSIRFIILSSPNWPVNFIDHLFSANQPKLQTFNGNFLNFAVKMFPSSDIWRRFTLHRLIIRGFMSFCSVKVNVSVLIRWLWAADLIFMQRSVETLDRVFVRVLWRIWSSEVVRGNEAFYLLNRNQREPDCSPVTANTWRLPARPRDPTTMWAFSGWT